MLLVALRHAKTASEGYASDEIRPLSEEGVRQCKEMIEKLHKLKLSFTHSFSSPYLRAKQTAEYIADAFKVENHTLLCLGVPPNASILSSQLHSVGKQSNCLIVGHMPFLADYLNTLVGNDTIGSLQPCGGALIEIDPSLYPLRGKLLSLL